MDKCVFCEIAAKRMPTAVVYEDADFVAFLDINPLNRGHTLVVPKKHVRWTYDIDKFGDYCEVAKAVAAAAVATLGAEYVNFFTMGEASEHANLHVVPRYKNDGHGPLPNPGNVKHLANDEMQSIANKLAGEIAKNPPKKCAEVVVQEQPAQKEDTKMADELEEEGVELTRHEFECG